MKLSQLHLVNFKNYAEASLAFNEGVTCLLGQNGAGKTNILDSIYYLSFCKSYFNPIDSQNIRHGESLFVVQGKFIDDEGNNEEVYCGFAKGKKKQFKRNKKEYEKLSDHIGKFPAVMISPQDSDLIQEGSDVRRKLLDGIIAQFNKPYLEHILSYQRLLQQRNALLKKFGETRRFDEDALEVYDEQMAPLATSIHNERKQFLEEFVPIFSSIFNDLSHQRETVSLEYSSQLEQKDIRELWKASRDADRHKQYTTSGVHKEDLIFKIGDHPIKRFGSQGQQKTFLIALKLAQYRHLQSKTVTKPMLLLDDIFDKLDGSRVEQLMKHVTQPEFGQVFVTDTSTDRLPNLFEKLGTTINSYEVTGGEIKKTESLIKE